MKRSFLLSVIIIAGIFGISTVAKAEGTPAGTVITNQAFADYQDANGNNLTRVFSNTVTTTVIHVAGVSVDPPTATKTGVAGTDVGYVVTVHNTGNSADTIDLTAFNSAGWTTVIYADTNQDGLWDPATETTVIADTGVLAADAFLYAVVVNSVPAGAALDDTATITLTGTSRFDTGVSDAGAYTTTVENAVLTVTKTVSNAAPLPGDVLTFAVTGKNTGTAAALNVQALDVVPANTTYVAGSMRVGPIGGDYATAASQTDAADGDNALFNSGLNRVELNWGDEAPYPPNGAGTGGVFYFQVQVNASVPAGTLIENSASASFELVAGGTRYTYTSNEATATVASAPSVSVTPTATTATGDPGDTITYDLTVCNTGNAADTIDMTYSSAAGWTWILWYDANDDGIAGNDGDYQLTDTDADGVRDTGLLSKGACASVLAVTTIPAGTPDGSTDTLVAIGRSSTNTTVSDSSGNLVTTVTAPLLQLSKTVDNATGAPGDTLTYTLTVTNIGTGVGASIVVTDIIPSFTTYTTASISTGADIGSLVSRTDAADGDGAEYDSGSSAVVAITPTLGAGGAFVVRYQVTID